MSRNKTYKVLILTTIFLLVFFVIPHHAHAVGEGFIESIKDAAIAQVVNYVNGLFLNLVGQVIAFFAQLLESFINFQTQNAVYNMPLINQSWTIIRNFVNLLFILVLIIMAFGTIFDIQRYTWRNMLVPFLIAALLINFSLAIGQYIIMISNGLAAIFLRQMQAPGVNGIAYNFQNGFSSAKLISSVSSSNFSSLAAIAPDATAGSISVIGNLILSVIFLIGVALAFIATAIFSVVRLYVLWFLLIISPLAWFGYSLPNLRKTLWSKWWNQFLCWCFWLPYFLFFMMFAVMFLKQKQAGAFLPSPTFLGLASMTASDFGYYILSLLFLFGGMIVAQRAACASGTGVKSVFGRIESGVRKYAPGAAYVRGAREGLRARTAEVQEKGVLGIGGARSARLQEAEAKGFVARIPGLGQVPGAKNAASAAMSTEIDKEVTKIRALNLTLDDLNKRLSTLKGIDRIAALKIKAENGWLDPNDQKEIISTVKNLGGTRNKAGAGFVDSLKKGDFERLFSSPADKETFIRSSELNTPEMVELKKSLLAEMAKRREIYNDDLIRQTAELFANETQDVKEKVLGNLQKNLSNVYSDLAEALKFTGKDGKSGTPAGVKRLIAKEMAESKKGINNYVDYKAVINAVGGEKTFEGQELTKKISENNPIVIDEAKFREQLALNGFESDGLAINPNAVNPVRLSDAERSRFADKLVEKLNKMEVRDIKNLSADAMSTPEMQYALNKYLGGLGKQTSEFMKNLSRVKREAIRYAQGTEEGYKEGPMITFNYVSKPSSSTPPPTQ